MLLDDFDHMDDTCIPINDAVFLLGSWEISIFAVYDRSNNTSIQLDGSFSISSQNLEFGSRELDVIQTERNNPNYHPVNVEWTSLEIDGQSISSFDCDMQSIRLTFGRPTRILQFGQGLGGAARINYEGEYGASHSLSFDVNARGVVNNDHLIVMSAESNSIVPNSVVVTLTKH